MIIYQVIPIIMTTLIYILIGLKLRRMTTSDGQGSAIETKRTQAVQTVKMLVSILGTYFILTLPAAIVTNFETIRSGQRQACHMPMPIVVWIMSVMANIVNPFILCYFNTTFKQQAIRTFCGRTQSNSVTISSTPNDVKSTRV